MPIMPRNLYKLLLAILLILIGLATAADVVDAASDGLASTSDASASAEDDEPQEMGIHNHYLANRPIKRAHIVVSEGSLTFDGITTAATMLNGSLPGPTLRFAAGDIAIINVTNAMSTRNTTVHWHGLSQRMTPRADGTLMAQWPIAPGRSFEYEMHLTEEDAGTRFYHTHVGLQSNNANGFLLIDHSTIPQGYEWEDEKSIMINDYWPRTEMDLQRQLLATPFKWIGTPNRTLVNGKSFGRGDNLTGSPAIIDVDFNKKTLLRYVGAQSLMYYSVALLNHTQTIIEYDATFIKPHTGDSVLEIGAGDRFATLVQTKTQAQVNQDGLDGCYWFRLESGWRLPAANGWAVLRYPGGCNNRQQGQGQNGGWSPPSTNNSVQILRPQQFGWIAKDLEARDEQEQVPDDSEVSMMYDLEARLFATTPGVPVNASAARWQGSENYTYTEEFPIVPYLVSLYQGLASAPSLQRAMNPVSGRQRGYDNTSHSFVVQSPSVIDVVILNNSSFTRQLDVHPWHFHSSKFWHIASGTGNFTSQGFANARAQGWKKPIKKDMITVWPMPGSAYRNETIGPMQSGGWSVFRYRVEEAQMGVWPLHCHINPHFVLGMATIFTVDAARFERTMKQGLGPYDDPNYLIFGRDVVATTTLKQRCATEGQLPAGFTCPPRGTADFDDGIQFDDDDQSEDDIQQVSDGKDDQEDSFGQSSDQEDDDDLSDFTGDGFNITTFGQGAINQTATRV